MNPQLVHYIPIATTVLSLVFAFLLLQRYWQRRSGPHLLWWAVGILCYGLGTAIESAVTLTGNTPNLNKAWYIAGALLGGYPLAQGSVYLLMRRRTAHMLSALTVPFILFLSCMVIMSPTDISVLEVHRPGGKALEWQWIRYFTPIINLYALFFLMGGAAFSAVRFAQNAGTFNRAIGNALIAAGALMPAVGGTMAKAGRVEWLYVGEFIGLLFIWAGYAACVKRATSKLEPIPATAVAAT